MERASVVGDDVDFLLNIYNEAKWFMETVDKFFISRILGISLPFNKSREELVSMGGDPVLDKRH
jgi:hypothetical protein